MRIGPRDAMLLDEGRAKYGARRVAQWSYAARDSRIGRKLRIAGERQAASLSLSLSVAAARRAFGRHEIILQIETGCR